MLPTNRSKPYGLMSNGKRFPDRGILVGSLIAVVFLLAVNLWQWISRRSLLDSLQLQQERTDDALRQLGQKSDSIRTLERLSDNNARECERNAKDLERAMAGMKATMETWREEAEHLKTQAATIDTRRSEESSQHEKDSERASWELSHCQEALKEAHNEHDRAHRSTGAKDELIAHWKAEYESEVMSHALTSASLKECEHQRAHYHHHHYEDYVHDEEHPHHHHHSAHEYDDYSHHLHHSEEHGGHDEHEEHHEAGTEHEHHVAAPVGDGHDGHEEHHEVGTEHEHHVAAPVGDGGHGDRGDHYEHEYDHSAQHAQRVVHEDDGEDMVHAHHEHERSHENHPAAEANGDAGRGEEDPRDNIAGTDGGKAKVVVNAGNSHRMYRDADDQPRAAGSHSNSYRVEEDF